MVLMSTPARSRCVAVVCRIECGLTRFVAVRASAIWSLVDVALNQGVNTKARYGMPAAIEKHNARGSAIRDERFEFLNGARPQRTLPLFATFAANLHGATGQI